MNRRVFLIGTPAVLAGCQHDAGPPFAQLIDFGETYRSMYASIDTERFPVPTIDLSSIDRRFLRAEVTYETSENPGTIVVDPTERYAYLILGSGRAIRYGVGVGREEAFNFNGAAVVLRKAEWPRWTPTPDMIRREPERYGKYAEGLSGGPRNPLGPRALYLFRNGNDTLYRLHGTVEPWTIGTMVSSGCVRFINQDIIDLYRRTPIGAKVVVLQTHG